MTSLTLALCVQNCPAGEFSYNVDRTVSFICQAASDGADIIVFPEMNLTGYVTGDKAFSIARPLDSSLMELFSGLARTENITILIGLAEKDTSSSSIFATHLIFSPDKPVRLYRKIHLAPNEADCYSPGNEVKVFSHSMAPFGVQLCYDAHFPELSTAMTLAGAKILYIPHASPRGSAMEKYHSWSRHLCARGFDNSVFVAAVNQTGENGQGLQFPGLAMVVGPNGKVIHSFTENREGLTLVQLDFHTLEQVREHRMKCFFPNRRKDLFPVSKAVVE